MVSPGTYLGIVKDNTDKLGMGRVRVYIPSFGGNPGDENTWYTASYMSPHAGQTNPYENTKGGKKEKESQDSYGAWTTGYDKENEVIISFPSSDPNSGIIMGAMFGQNMVNAIGGHPTANTHQGSNMPSVEYNKRDDEINPRNPIRPRNEQLYQQLVQQGLLGDKLRGTVSTSPLRDLVPQFMSMKTRRGSIFAMDDGKMDSNSGAGVNTRSYSRQSNGGTSLIRFRTEGGAQISMNDDCGFIHMISSNGNSVAQLSDNGVSMFTEGSIAWRVQGNFNMRVDGNYASETLGDTLFKVGGNLNMTTEGGINIKDQDGVKFDTDGMYGLKTEGNSIQESGGTISQMSSANMVKKAANIMKYTASGYTAPPVQALTIGKAKDTNSEGESQDADTTLPANGLTSHEPWAGNGQVCGMPSDPAEQQEDQEINQDDEFTEDFSRAKSEDLNTVNNILKEEGYSKEARAAIIGSFVTESNLNPNIKGDNGQAYGLAQWHPDRQAGLVRFAQANGMDPTSLDTQTRYFVAESTAGSGYGSVLEHRAGNTLRNATSLDQAMYGMKQYERYGVAGNRYSNAQAIYGILH